MVRLDTQASGLLFAGQSTNQTMKRAAELTVQNGYTNFRFEQANLQQGSQMAGVYSSGSATAYGTTNGTTTNVTVNGSSFSTPIYRPTSSVGVTVIMFHAEEPGAQGAFDAAQVLQQMNS
jgi:hypothetical protein